jgi:uncharacterized protein YecT (DUF1311 family)
MLRGALVVALVTSGMAASGIAPAQAASFDCSKAATPFEKAICSNDDLSRADDRLAKTYATASGGLGKVALGELRASQHDWLAHAQRACTRTAEPLTTGGYDERGLGCLVDLFNSRSDVLETSRMIDGLRFYPASLYDAKIDTYEQENPESNWPVAIHSLSYPQRDGGEGAEAFNAWVKQVVGEVSALAGAGEGDGSDDTSDSTVSLEVETPVTPRRISLRTETYWYGHGAAHGNYALTFENYLVDEDRSMVAEDLFAGADWQQTLLDATVAALRAEHGDNLMLGDDEVDGLLSVVTDPTRWEISDDYALLVQFQPYEVAAYAYGAPVARVPWTALEGIMAEGAEGVRYGY